MYPGMSPKGGDCRSLTTTPPSVSLSSCTSSPADPGFTTDAGPGLRSRHTDPWTSTPRFWSLDRRRCTFADHAVSRSMSVHQGMDRFPTQSPAPSGRRPRCRPGRAPRPRAAPTNSSIVGRTPRIQVRITASPIVAARRGVEPCRSEPDAGRACPSPGVAGRRCGPGRTRGAGQGLGAGRELLTAHNERSAAGPTGPRQPPTRAGPRTAGARHRPAAT